MVLVDGSVQRGVRAGRWDVPQPRMARVFSGVDMLDVVVVFGFFGEMDGIDGSTIAGRW